MKSGLFVSCAAALSLAFASGCSSSDDKGGSSSGSAAQDGGGKSDAASGSSASLGTNCTKYYGCCPELASKLGAQAQQACDQSKSATQDAIAKGAKASDYETACKSALDAAQQAGVCK